MENLISLLGLATIPFLCDAAYNYAHRKKKLGVAKLVMCCTLLVIIGLMVGIYFKIGLLAIVVASVLYYTRFKMRKNKNEVENVKGFKDWESIDCTVVLEKEKHSHPEQKTLLTRVKKYDRFKKKFLLGMGIVSILWALGFLYYDLKCSMVIGMLLTLATPLCIFYSHALYTSKNATLFDKEYRLAGIYWLISGGLILISLSILWEKENALLMFILLTIIVAATVLTIVALGTKELRKVRDIDSRMQINHRNRGGLNWLLFFVCMVGAAAFFRLFLIN